MARLRYMFDTNVVSALVRDPRGALARRVAALPPGSFGISLVVAGELRYGVKRRNSRRLAKQVEAVLSGIPILSPNEPTDRHYGEIRSALERIGRPIGQNDLWIAAHARAVGAIMVTGNLREFRRVPQLRVEDWGKAPRRTPEPEPASHAPR